jgi:hypothetical protein
MGYVAHFRQHEESGGGFLTIFPVAVLVRLTLPLANPFPTVEAGALTHFLCPIVPNVFARRSMAIGERG